MSDQPVDVRRCGRETKSGAPCRAHLYGYELVCKLHATEHDRELAEAYARGHRDGHHAGYESGTTGAKEQIERLKLRVMELEQGLDSATRIYEV